jgi:uncharacterized protein (TIGR02118 family)
MSNYVKRIGLLRRRTDMGYEDFKKHWLDVHAELCVKIPGLKKYAVNFVVKDAPTPLGFDGFSELWFEDEAALNASLTSAEGKALLADLPNFAHDVQPLVVLEYKKL